MIIVGTCGFGRSRARTLANLGAVEVQETFYRPVSLERAKGWRAAAPPGFVFAVKASQFITHEASSPTYRRSGRTIPEPESREYGGFRDSAAVQEGWEATRRVADELLAEVLVFQTPRSFQASPENVAALYRFFASARTEATKAWEPRGPWPSHLLEKACEDLGLVHAVDPFAGESSTVGRAYFRLHGSPPGRTPYRYSYTDKDLDRLRDWCEEYDDAYVMFNNVTMYDDAMRFRRLLRTEGGGI